MCQTTQSNVPSDISVCLSYSNSHLLSSLLKLRVHAPRRRRAHPDEGWAEWPVLGKGWKRKEVVRRSGSSIGQKDVYYMG